MVAESQAHELEALLEREAAAWRAVRARVPGYDADHRIALEDLSLQQLVLVESFLAARSARRELLHPVVPEQSSGMPTSPGGQPIQ